MASTSGSANDTPIVNNKGYIKPNGDSIDTGWTWNSYKDKNKRAIKGITKVKKHQLGL